MEWQWNANGKRYRVLNLEDTKKKRIGQADVVMEDENIQNRIYVQRLQHKLERELNIYKQQIKENNYVQCCNKKY